MEISAKGEDCMLAYDTKRRVFSGNVDDVYFTDKKADVDDDDEYADENMPMFYDKLYIDGHIVHNLFSYNATIDGHNITDNKFIPHNLLLKCGFDKDTCDTIEDYMDKNDIPYTDFFEFERVDFMIWMGIHDYDTCQKLAKFTQKACKWFSI